jgi:hypothetical protein
VQFGPSFLLQVILGALDRTMDRGQARVRADAAKEIMKDVKFEKAWQTLAPTCFNLMKYVPETEARDVAARIKDFSTQTQIEDGVKALNLGLLLIDVVGPDVLRSAVDALGDKIR